MIAMRNGLYNSVIGKELRTRMRGWRSIAVVTAYMVVLGVIAIGYLVQQAGPTTGQSSQIGVQLFQALAAFQLFLIVFITPASTAGAISGERQRQTWDLLLVTRLSTFGIVWGKLLAGLAFDVLLIFASLPLFSLVFLFGGVAPNDVIQVYVVFLATVLLLGTVSLFVSALTRRVAASMIVGNVLALLLSVGLSILAAYLEKSGQPAIRSGARPARARAPAHPAGTDRPVCGAGVSHAEQQRRVILGDLGTIHHAFLLPITIHLWGAFAIVSVLFSAVLLALTTLVARHTPRWLGRDAA